MTDTKHKILEAADTLFCKSGYDGVSIRDIAHEADVDKASVFYHFDDKQTLFETILDRYYDAHRTVLEEALAGDGPPRQRLHDAIDAYLDFIDDHRRYPRLVQGLLTRDDHHAHVVERSLAPLFDYIVDALADVTPPDGPKSARHFFVTFSGAVVNYFTYAPALHSAWGDDPLADDQIDERRQHLHWLVDTCLDALLDDA